MHPPGFRQWPKTQATVTDIERPDPNDPEFLSRITFDYQDAAGASYSGSLPIRTSDLANNLRRGDTLSIRYSPGDPQQTWFEDAYARRSRLRRVAFLFAGVAFGLSVMITMIILRIR